MDLQTIILATRVRKELQTVLPEVAAAIANFNLAIADTLFFLRMELPLLYF